MSLKYILKKEDQIAFYKKYLKENSIIYKNYIFGIALILVILIKFLNGPNQIKTIINDVVVSAKDLNFFVDILVNLAILIGLIFLIRYIYLEKIGNTINKNPSLIGEREIELNDDKILIISNDSKMEFNLVSIKRISDYNNKYFFIYFDKQIAIILPKLTNGSKELINQIIEKTKINIS